jgi:hypothetical protein
LQGISLKSSLFLSSWEIRREKICFSSIAVIFFSNQNFSCGAFEPRLRNYESQSAIGRAPLPDRSFFSQCSGTLQGATKKMEG